MSAYNPFGFSGGRTTINNGATELSGLNDVNITNPAQSEVITYDTGSGKWINTVQSGGGGGSSTLAGLTDTNIVSLANKNLLQYNSTSSAWENKINLEIGTTTHEQDKTVYNNATGYKIEDTGTQTRFEVGNTDDISLYGNLIVKTNAGTAKFTIDTSGNILKTGDEIINKTGDQVIQKINTTSGFIHRFADNSVSSSFKIQDNLSTDIFRFNADGSLSGINLNKLDDVITTVGGGPANGQLLRYDTVAGNWTNYTFDINDINDVVITGATQEDLLFYDSVSGNFINGRLPLGDFCFNTNQILNNSVPYLQFAPASVSVVASDLTLGQGRTLSVGDLDIVSQGQNLDLTTTDREWKFENTNNQSKFIYKFGNNTANCLFSITDDNDVVLFSVDGTGTVFPSGGGGSTANFTFNTNQILVDAIFALGLTNTGQLTLRGDVDVNKISPGTITFLQNALNSGFNFRFNDASSTSIFQVSNNASQPIIQCKANQETVINGPVFFNNKANTNTNFQINDNGTFGGMEINNLDDVLLTAPAVDEILKYNGGQWVNNPYTISSITDVNLTALQNGDTIVYDSLTSTWINQTPAGTTANFVFNTNTITTSGQARPIFEVQPINSNEQNTYIDSEITFFRSNSAGGNYMFFAGNNPNETIIQITNTALNTWRWLLANNNSNIVLQNQGTGGGVVCNAENFRTVNFPLNFETYSVNNSTIHNWRSNATGVTACYSFNCNGNPPNTTALQILGDGTVNIPNLNPSDERDKVNIEDLDKDFGLDFIKKLRPVSYNLDERVNYYNDKEIYDDDDDEKCNKPDKLQDVDKSSKKHQKERKGFGIVAQELVDIKGINDKDFELVEERSDRYLVNYIQLIAPLIKAVQELSEEVEDLKKQIK